MKQYENNRNLRDFAPSTREIPAGLAGDNTHPLESSAGLFALFSFVAQPPIFTYL